jgi:AcrR family transcriptional regulator
MNSEDSQAKRTYASPLRAEQANQTRERILEAFAEQVVDGGLADFSIERVAARAGVSPRTVYHHYPRRDDLLDAINDWIDQRFGASTLSPDTTAEELVTQIEEVFRLFDQHETLIRAQLMTRLGQSLRARGRTRRRPVVEQVVRDAAPGMPPAMQKQVAAVIHYLASSEAWRSFRDESGLSGAEAGRAVAWALRTLIGSLQAASTEPPALSEEQEQKGKQA